MSLLSKLFGEWVVIQSGPAVAECESAILSKEWKEQVFVTVERHSRTNKERAFIHRIDGRKQATSVYIVRASMPKVTS